MNMLIHDLKKLKNDLMVIAEEVYTAANIKPRRHRPRYIDFYNSAYTTINQVRMLIDHLEDK